MENGMEYAIKAFHKEELLKEKEAQPALKNEIKLMRRLRGHSCIIQLYEVYETVNNIYLIMESVTGGTLQNKIMKSKRIRLEETLTIMRQLCEGIHFMHERNVMHRDLKLANILLVHEEKNMGVKLVDFGLATDVDDLPYLYHRCGTPGYVAPELFTVKEGEKYSPACDVFSLGVIFYIS
jgi:serine/threonine protein kinase